MVKKLSHIDSTDHVFHFVRRGNNICHLFVTEISRATVHRGLLSRPAEARKFIVLFRTLLEEFGIEERRTFVYQDTENGTKYIIDKIPKPLNHVKLIDRCSC